MKNTIPEKQKSRQAVDSVIEALALSEAELLERVASLEEDVVRYREVAQITLAIAHDLTVDRDRERHLRHELIDEYRRVRERVLFEEGVAA